MRYRRDGAPAGGPRLDEQPSDTPFAEMM